jgi:23S rRNA (cytosine1962-C5)-methyltransferase
VERAAVWPDFRAEWVVADDGDVIVVDKPVGVSSQAAEEGRPDDVVTRLRAWLDGGDVNHVPRPPEGRPAYLGVHQRLDRDTSGLLLFARRKEMNASLAKQFEGRSVKKTYLAAVAGWPKGKDRVTLRDVLAPDRDGTMRVASRGARDGKLAVTHVKVVARRAERAVLELALETGRTHQARVQLAHAGCPIAGDALYAGPAAPRLMLHASRLELAHPGTGKPARYDAPTPPELDAWLADGDPGDRVYDDAASLARALARAVERRWGLGRSSAGDRVTTAFRLVNEDGDALPRLAVDVYGDFLVAQLHDDAPAAAPRAAPGPRAESLWADLARRDRLLDALAALGFDGVYLKVRPRQANVLVDTRREELAPRLPVRGVAAPEPLAVVEEGMPLLVRLGDGLSTGVFLDQRANRRRVRELARGASVANLFAYTCAFTLAAALGGAKRTVSVDASAAALERGRENLAHAGVLEAGDHAFVADDAFAWLARAARKGERFDLVVLDPPSYSSTKKGRFVADTDYAKLAAQALALLAPGGRLLASTNHRGISPSRFRRILFDAGREVGIELAQVKDLPLPLDYPLSPGGHPPMKALLARRT